LSAIDRWIRLFDQSNADPALTVTTLVTGALTSRYLADTIVVVSSVVIVGCVIIVATPARGPAGCQEEQATHQQQEGKEVTGLVGHGVLL
jgi:hypothetical protein